MRVSTDESGAEARRGTLWEGYVRRCAQRDQTALAALYDQSAALVFAIAFKILANHADAEEVTIDVYDQVWRRASSFEAGRGTVTAWLVMLARSRAIDRIRSRASRERKEEAIFNYVDFASSNEGPEQITATRQRKRQLHAGLASLSAEQRQMLELAFFSGLTHVELANRLDMPLGTVKTRIRSSIMKLRETLPELA